MVFECWSKKTLVFIVKVCGGQICAYIYNDIGSVCPEMLIFQCVLLQFCAGVRGGQKKPLVFIEFPDGWSKNHWFFLRNHTGQNRRWRVTSDWGEANRCPGGGEGGRKRVEGMVFRLL